MKESIVVINADYLFLFFLYIIFIIIGRLTIPFTKSKITYVIAIIKQKIFSLPNEAMYIIGIPSKKRIIERLAAGVFINSSFSLCLHTINHSIINSSSECQIVNSS